MPDLPIYYLIIMRLKLLFLSFLCMLAATLPGKAETLTVYNGTTTNEYVPIYGYYCDAYLKCEFVIPASQLENMNNGEITGLTWYLSSVASDSWGNAHFQVFIKEVSSASISAFSGTTGATMVYEGSLSGTQSTMNINFTKTYTYGGGNLLIGVYNTVKGSYKSAKFYGQTVSGACVQGYSSSSLSGVSPTQCNFIPKTTFTYEPASDYPKPLNVAVDNITARSAKVTWDGDANALSYNLRYREVGGMVNSFFDDFENGLNDWTIYTDGEAPNTNGWYQYNPSSICNAVSGSYVASAWSWASTAYDADNWLITPQVTFDKKLKFWVRTASGWPDSYAVLLSTTGNQESDFTVTLQAMATAPTNDEWNQVSIDLSAYENQTGYIAIHHVSNDCNYLFIDDFAIGHEIPTGEWETIPNAVSPQDITGLNPNTEYEVQVQAVYEDDSSDWTNSVHFTTLGPGAMPTDLAVSDVTAYTAKATWNGSQDSYNLRYRKITFFESFEGSFPGNWTIVDSDGDGYTWSQTDLTTQFEGSYSAVEGNNVVMSRSWINSTVGAVSPDQWLISPQVELGGMLKYFVMDELNFPETYRIYVSTSGTDISDFQPLTDDLLTPNTNKWTECTVDLSAYNGVPGYIAFRHYNCYDQSFMFIDAVSIGDNWTTVNNVTSPKTITGLAAESNYEVEVQGSYDNNTTDWTLPVYFTTLEAPLAEEATLADICASGQEGLNKVYTISDQLIAVDYREVGDNDVYLWCKDLNQSINKTQIKEGQLDFMKEQGAQVGEWDQSNWVILKLSGQNGVAKAAEAVKDNSPHYITAGTVTGTYVDDMNYMIEVADNNFTVGDVAEFTPNVYCATNFVQDYQNLTADSQGAQTVGNSSVYYFFMNPKINEICTITWAKWQPSDDATGYFTVPSSSGFDGAFNVDWTYNGEDSSKDLVELDDEENEVLYEFTAVIQRNSYNYGPAASRIRAHEPDDAITVQAMDLTAASTINPSTAISTVKAGNGEVVGVYYVNTVGVMSKNPFPGVNVVVTRYSDGSRSSVKKVFK